MSNLPRDTIPCSPDEDTAPPSAHDTIRARAAISIRDAFDQLEEHKKALELAEYQTHRALGLAADEEAKRVPTRMERIESKLDALVSAMKDLTDGLFEDHQKVVAFDEWKREHVNFDNHCGNCELRRGKAKEA